jgi:hypothetical protein
MTHLEILCYAIAHIDYLKEDLQEKRMRFAGNPEMQEMTDMMIGDLDYKKAKLKTLYEIECGSKYSE